MQDFREYAIDSLPYVSMLIIVLMLANIALAELIHRLTIKSFNKYGSAQKAFQTKRRLEHAYIIITLISKIVVCYYFVPIIVSVERVFIFLAILVPFFYVLLVRVGSSVILSRTYNILEDTKKTLREIVREDLGELLFYLFPFFVFIYFLAFFFYFISKAGIEPSIGVLGVFLILSQIAIHFPIPFIYKALFYAVPIEDHSVKQIIEDLFKKQSIKKVSIYQFSKKDDATATVTGLAVCKRIFVTDFLIKVLSREELEAILLHEIGHVKKHHLGIGVLIDLCFGFFAMGSIYGLEFIGYMFDFYIPELFYYVIGLIIVFLNGLFVFPKVSRIHERQADEYVIKNGIAPETLISALEKIISADDYDRIMTDRQERFASHPSLKNRIKYIKEFAEAMGKGKDVQEVSLHKAT